MNNTGGGGGNGAYCPGGGGGGSGVDIRALRPHKYRLIWVNDSSVINKYLTEGWDLYGSPTCNHNGTIFQAVIYKAPPLQHVPTSPISVEDSSDPDLPECL